MDPLGVPQVARVLDHDRLANQPGRLRQQFRIGSQPFVHVEHPLGEGGRRRRPQQSPVALQRGAAARRVHEDVSVPRQGGHDRLGAPHRLPLQAGVPVQRPAAPHGFPGPFDAAASRHQDILHGVVDLRLAGIHHATREEQHIATGRRAASSASQGKPGR